MPFVPSATISYLLILAAPFALCTIDLPRRVAQTGKRRFAVRRLERPFAMSTYPPPGPGAPGPGGVGRRIEEAVELIEMELRHTIAYVNDAVIPQVRRESISAMRNVADTLRNLADRIEQTQGQPGNQPRNPRS